MSFVDKLRAELIDIVEWVDDSRHTLVWRFPRYQNQIKNGAQLIVRPGQLAILVYRGQMADIFQPGHYNLKTENIPVLSTLAGWVHGFTSPFKAEVYFIATRQITELKWGTPNPVIMRDPDFGPVRVRAFGSYTLRARDPRALLRELVGTDSEFDAEEINVLLRAIVNNSFAELVAKAGISVIDLASNYGDLSERLRQAVLDRVDDEYGLDIPQLWIVNISLPEEVERAIDSRSSMGIVGDLDRYQKYQIGSSIPVAAENPAGGLAAAGVGLGMGMSYANGMTGAAPASGTAAPPALPGGAMQAVWYVGEDGRTSGPLTSTQLADAITAGQVAADTMVWTAGMSGWLPASQVPQLSRLFFQTPPPLPPS